MYWKILNPLVLNFHEIKYGEFRVGETTEIDEGLVDWGKILHLTKDV